MHTFEQNKWIVYDGVKEIQSGTSMILYIHSNSTPSTNVQMFGDIYIVSILAFTYSISAQCHSFFSQFHVQYVFQAKILKKKKHFLQPEVGKSTTLWRFWFSHFHMKIWCFTCKIIFRPFFHGMPVHMAQIYTDLFLNVKEYVNILYIKRHPTPQQFDIIRYQSFILIASLLSKFRTLQNITIKLILIEFIYCILVYIYCWI